MNLKDITDTAKTALDIANELKHIELKEAILELKEKMIELREENIVLKEQLKEKQKHNLQFIDNLYWELQEDGSKIGPYCPACLDGKGKAVRMIKNYEFNFFICSVCKGKMPITEYNIR